MRLALGGLVAVFVGVGLAGGLRASSEAAFFFVGGAGPSEQFFHVAGGVGNGVSDEG